jgi:hypothetical protein
LYSDLLRDVATAGGPEQDSRLQAHRVHERLDIIGEVHQGISVGRLVSITMAALIHRE